MSELITKEKNIAVPGEVLAKGMEFLPSDNTRREGEEIIASRLGLVKVEGKVIKLIPLSGVYFPKVGDVVIGQVIDVTYSGWRLDVNCAYEANLSMKDASSDFIRRGADLTKYFNIGDFVVAKITNVTSQNLIDLSAKGPGLRRLDGGRVISVNTHKVPRIIGRQGSMVSMIKTETNTMITVGQNGLIWIQGDPKNEILAVETIEKIEREAHIEGLTDRIKEFLEKNKVK